MKRSLFFKDLSVRRIYDPESHCLIYVSYSTRLSQTMEEPNARFRTSISTVPLEGEISREDVAALNAPK